MLHWIQVDDDTYKIVKDYQKKMGLSSPSEAAETMIRGLKTMGSVDCRATLGTHDA